MGEASSSKPLSPLRIPDSPLSTSDVLSREELLRRRSGRLRQVTKLYKAFYWALMEELRAKYKDYYWRYGKSPYYNGEEEDEEEEEEEEQERNRNGNGNEEDVEEMRCEVTGCKAKAMALTRYCHAHILSDTKQNLYKACTYCIKR